MPPHEIQEEEDGTRLILMSHNQLPDADVYVLQRRMEPHWVELTRRLREQGKIVIAETDDYFLGTPSYNPAQRATQPYTRSFAVSYDDKNQPYISHIKRERKYANRDNMHQSWRAAGALTVSTPFLAEVYSRYNPNVHVIPNYLDWEMWEGVEPQYEVNRPKLRIGWMGKMKWRMGDLAILRGIIGPFLRRHPEVEFVAAGDGGTATPQQVHDFLEIPEDQRVTYSEAKFLEIADITAVMDIGLVPLEINNFNEAKSHLKGMEYAACGVPCIASPTESYRTWVDEGSNGFLARRPKDWLRHLETLVSDDELRREMGRKAREKAQRNTIQEHVGQWENLYASMLGARLISSIPATSAS